MEILTSSPFGQFLALCVILVLLALLVLLVIDVVRQRRASRAAQARMEMAEVARRQAAAARDERAKEAAWRNAVQQRDQNRHASMAADARQERAADALLRGADPALHHALVLDDAVQVSTATWADFQSADSSAPAASPEPQP